MKKFGRFLFSFVPLIVALAIQFCAMFFVFGICLLLSFFHATSMPSFDTMLANENVYGLVMVVYALLVVIAYAFWYHLMYKGNLFPKAKETFTPAKMIACIVIVPGLQFMANFITGIIATIFPRLLDQYMELIDEAGLSGEIGILMLLYAVIFGPIAEELIFRGVTMRSFRKIMPFWIANLLQALLFGIYHMNLIQGVYAFALGLFLGYFCERGGSIYYSIFVHILFNLWGTLLPELIDNLPETLLAVLMVAGLIVSIALGMILLWLGRRKQPVLDLESSQKDILFDPPAPAMVGQVPPIPQSPLYGQTYYSDQRMTQKMPAQPNVPTSQNTSLQENTDSE